ncbi:hypothetical protein Mmc1_3356 [Magnetococcus marinus MC-1]|uniref:Uncharacterized protein n=1 Tax=Magnetococcus marinus (strain ATCC BAA-1437 / JCM 17883 / MC-1) TaxID=156889 RepID=A0LCZ9_MAGMM|nr:hypothetical protein [Magnetococcus marinus]ABK45842.1 hypothetical protein Mmc1_3356 [Magnetococcus marinus MC-1]
MLWIFWLVVGVTVLLLTATGALLYRWSVPGAINNPLALQLGAGYFSAMGLWMVVSRLLSWPLPAGSLGWLLGLGLLTLSGLLWWRRADGLLVWKKLRKAVDGEVLLQLGATLVLVLALLPWNMPVVEPQAGAGVALTQLWSEQAKLSVWMVSHQQWLGTANCVLQSWPTLLGVTATSQTAWLAAHGWMLGLTLFGLMRWFGLKGNRQWMGLAVVMVGQSCWSLLPVQMQLGGLQLLGLADGNSLLLLGGLLVWLLWFNDRLKQSAPLRLWDLPMPALLLLLCAITVPLLWPVVVVPLLGFLLWARWRYHWSGLGLMPWLTGLLLVVLVVLGLGDGRQAHAVVENPQGAWQWQPEHAPMQVLPTLWSDTTTLARVAIEPGVVRHLDQLESAAWHQLRGLFFPFVGMVLMAVWVMTGQEHALGPPPEGRVLGAREGPYTMLVAGMFAVSFTMLLLLGQGTPKWSMTPILLPASTLGLLFFVVGLKRFLAGLNGWARELMWGTLLGVTLWGPVTHLLARLF